MQKFQVKKRTFSRQKIGCDFNVRRLPWLLNKSFFSPKIFAFEVFIRLKRHHSSSTICLKFPNFIQETSRVFRVVQIFRYSGLKVWGVGGMMTPHSSVLQGLRNCILGFHTMAGVQTLIFNSAKNPASDGYVEGFNVNGLWR